MIILMGGVVMLDLMLNLPDLTIGFIAIIAFLTIFFTLIKYDHMAITYGPTILTTIGIFGCFLGIALGLLDFDTNNIQGSVPDMVDGIKTSFWASVFGIGGALVVKGRLMIFGGPIRKANQKIQAATIDDLANLLQGLQQSLAGEDDSTLISQVKLMRQDSNDRLDKLQKGFEDCLEKMADNNSKVLIEALKEVIRDFNTKINEQFGDNFRQLNAAVEKILEWQEAYRNQVSEMIEQQTVCAQNMTESAKNYSELVNKSDIFVNVANKLEIMLNTFEAQRTQMESSLKSLGDLLTKASGSLPEIEQKIVDMTRQVSEGVRANNEEISASLKAATQSIQTNNADMRKSLIESIQNANQEMSNNIKQLSENTKEQVVALDNALGQELTKSLESLGRQLTALSNKFVEDYSPLTDRLRQVVQIAQGV